MKHSYWVFYYGEKEDSGQQKEYLSLDPKWLKDPVWMDIYCYTTKGKPFNFEIQCANMYKYRKSGVFMPKFVLVGPDGTPKFPDIVQNRRNGIEIIEHNEIKKKLDYEEYEKRSHNGEFSINQFIRYECKVTNKYSLERYKQLYEQIHAHEDIVIKMLQTLMAEPFNYPEFGFYIRDSYFRLYYGGDYCTGYDYLAVFNKFGMDNIPAGRVDLRVALADLIIELVCSKWLQATNDNKLSISMGIDHEYSKVRVHFKYELSSAAPKKDSNLKSW